MVSGSTLDHASHQKPSRPRRWLAWLWMSHLAALPAAAEPAEPAEPDASLPEQVELHFVGSPECPGEANFVREIAARVRRPIEWVAASGALRVAVTVTQGQDHATGTVRIVARDSEPTRREFSADTCAEITSALALVTALTLDPNARTDALAPSDDQPVSPAPSRPESPPLPAPAPAPAPMPPVAAPPTRKPYAATPTSRERVRYVAWLGPMAGLDAGYAPGPLVTFGLSLGARLAITPRFSPSLQLSPLWGKTGATGPAASDGSFAWAMARLSACPLNVQLTSWLGLEPCLQAELGRLTATGQASPKLVAESAERWWAAAGAGLALHVDRGPWFARFETHATVPATRDTFVFVEPYQQVHRPSALGYGLGLGFGAEFGR
jgi:hypothetical protein